MAKDNVQSQRDKRAKEKEALARLATKRTIIVTPALERALNALGSRHGFGSPPLAPVMI